METICYIMIYLGAATCAWAFMWFVGVLEK